VKAGIADLLKVFEAQDRKIYRYLYIVNRVPLTIEPRGLAMGSSDVVFGYDLPR